MPELVNVCWSLASLGVHLRDTTFTLSAEANQTLTSQILNSITGYVSLNEYNSTISGKDGHPRARISCLENHTPNISRPHIDTLKIAEVANYIWAATVCIFI